MILLIYLAHYSWVKKIEGTVRDQYLQLYPSPALILKNPYCEQRVEGFVPQVQNLLFHVR